VRGFRIELEEVEAALEQHPAVRQGIVLDREDTPGERYLAAYLLAVQDPPLTVEALRAYLHTLLPPHMVPTAFVFLDTMPQTPSGKVNRRALPAPPRWRPALSAAFVAPRTPTEEVVASIWSRVLDLEGVGIHDNFFDLGGHSLLAVRVLSRLREAFQTAVSLQALFDAPSVASLASHIDRQRREAAGESAPALAPMPRPRAIPVTLAQEHIWLLAQLLPRTPFFHISHAFRLTGLLRLDALEHSFNALIQRHESLRTAFAPQQGQLVQHIAEALTLTLVIEDLSAKSQSSHQAAVQRLIQQEAERPFVLREAPLMRVRLLQVAEHEYVLLLTWHHLIMDGWSMGVFTRELALSYDAFVQGVPPALPPLRVQYADYTLWYEKWRATAARQRQLAYWRQQLHPPLPCLHLPLDRPRQSVRGFHTARQTFAIPQELAEALRRLSRQESVTLFMALLAAFKILLHIYTGQDDLCVATHVANRGHREVEDLIGYLVNTVFLRTHLGEIPRFANFCNACVPRHSRLMSTRNWLWKSLPRF
jgi:acyl carrier protein